LPKSELHDQTLPTTFYGMSTRIPYGGERVKEWIAHKISIRFFNYGKQCWPFSSATSKHAYRTHLFYTTSSFLHQTPSSYHSLELLFQDDSNEWQLDGAWRRNKDSSFLNTHTIWSTASLEGNWSGPSLFAISVISDNAPDNVHI